MSSPSPAATHSAARYSGSPRAERSRPTTTLRIYGQPRRRRSPTSTSDGTSASKPADSSFATSCGSSERTTTRFRRDRTEVIRTLTSPGSPGIGQDIFADVDRDLFAGKLTYRLSNSQTLTGSINGDPGEREGNIFAIAGPASTWAGERKFGATGGVVRYDGVFGGNFLVKGLYGQHRESDEFAGPGKTIARFIDSTVTPNARLGRIQRPSGRQVPA